MSTKHFQRITHIVESSHIRQYPHALADSQEDVLRIAVKQYIPTNNKVPRPGDLTIIASHANGVGKELYESLWDDLFEQSQKSHAFRIRSIWMADVAWQGESGVLNENKLGDDPSWYDHPRDLLHFINTFRKELPLPIVGVGHSMGGNHIVNLSLMHPRLFAGVILIDPVIQDTPSRAGNQMPAVLSTFRRDIWPSRQEAEQVFRRNKFYQSWDQRCFDLWIEHGLRDLPTSIYQDYDSATQSSMKSTPGVPDSSPVTLTTTKYQEVFTFTRGNHPPAGTPLDDYQPNKVSHPDLTNRPNEKPFYRPESHITFDELPHLRPPCFYVFASDKSDLSNEDFVSQRLESTGVGTGGSGGVKNGMVKTVDIKNAGHFVPFEKPKEVAKNMNDWLNDTLQKWLHDAEADRSKWATVNPKEKKTFTEDRLYWTKWLREEQKKDEQKKHDSRNVKL